MGTAYARLQLGTGGAWCCRAGGGRHRRLRVRPKHTGATYSQIPYARIRDFVTFGPAQVLIDTGGDIIDTTMIRAAGKTFPVQQGRRPRRPRPLRRGRLSLFADDFRTTQLNIGRAQCGSVEGPLVFKDSEADKWYLYVDQFGNGQATGPSSAPPWRPGPGPRSAAPSPWNGR